MKKKLGVKEKKSWSHGGRLLFTKMRDWRSCSIWKDTWEAAMSQRVPEGRSSINCARVVRCSKGHWSYPPF